MRVAGLLLSTAVVALTATTAFAADLPSRAAPPVYAPAPLPVFTWTGAYLGINAGYVDGTTRFDRTTGVLANNNASLNTGIRPTRHTIGDDGFTAGGQIGYNYQLGGLGGFGGVGSGIVVGVEADAAYTDLDRTDTFSNTSNFGALVTPGAAATTRVNQYRSELDFLGTVRGRVGYAFNQFLIFGTGGFAYGDVNRRTTYYGPNADTTPFFQGSNNGIKTGYVYGGGIEYALTANSFLSFLNVFHSSAVTIKAEYLRYDLGSDTLTFPAVGAAAALGLGGYSERVRTEGDIARAGINYKF
ncbi:porin family protein [Lichenihabitans sp. Uapishka_5]|uniref:outer membrane protein n=1 Tax=Lichenihabitans sp. Uapishka_5 TaxID=3037302 RepID=UPI0029E817B6|nr:porin family protein [Lichenihabitans sp. Uapishka_5]MDX7953119.1 porin family protein [Lichenihabitans sp. Uapishka_5]